jgi:two-component system, OmpR family, phosphate regulon sensor histidine kinase PhoR
MTPRPPFARLLLVFAVLLAAIVAVTGWVVYTTGKRSVWQQQTEQLQRLTPLFREWLSQTSPPQQLDAQTRQRLMDASRTMDVRVTLIAGDGRVFFDTHRDAATMDNHNYRPEVVGARQKGISGIERRSSTIEEESMYVAELLDRSQPNGVVIRASFPEHTWKYLAVAGWQVVAGGVLSALLAVGMLWFILQRRWIGPTQDLVRTADRLAAGEWHTRAEPRGAAPLQFFSTRLNLVASHAQQQLADLRDQRADLQALVDTLPDPVLLTAADGKVALINRPAAKLLSLSRAKALGQNVVHVVSDDAILQLVDRVQSVVDPAENGDESASLTRVIRLHRDGQYQTFQAVAQRTVAGGVLVVLRDVTALAATVQMKTDFVANASHELRTPIAAIKIAFETLRDVYGDDAHQTERCMSIIDGHLKRLEEMLGDLLDLSRVENPNLKPVVSRLKTSEVLAHVRSSLGPMARQKLVELRLGVQDGDDADQPSDFLCDQRLLGLIVKNLVENAIKFTPAGGSVSLTLSRGAPATNANDAGEPPVILTVADTGVGIPPEHLDRVFERFYQVDPARSGSAGRGTGLGLAIVKHALAALGGMVEIESTVGEGTKVRCTLPQTAVEVPAEDVAV